MNLKQLFCKHDYPPYETTWETIQVTTEKDAYHRSGNVFIRCKKCGYTKLTGTFSEYITSDEAVRIIIDVSKELGIFESYYKNQEWGSFYYGEFRSYVAEILDRSGKDVAKSYARGILKSHKGGS